MAQSHPGAGDLSSWADIADTLDNLPTIIRAIRRDRRQSLREVARRAGLSFSTVQRAESGEDMPNAESLSKMLRWLDGTNVAEDPSLPSPSSFSR